jgi:hydroxypyruvate isomerase
MAFILAACAEMLYLDLPMVERARTIHERGFAVEIWDWTAHDLAALAATGATFTSMTGYVSGSLTEPAGVEALLVSAERSIRASRTLGTPNLNLHGTGLGPDGLPVRPVDEVTETMWSAAVETLARVAELGRREEAVFCLENLNTVLDHPGTPFAAAADTAALVAAVDSPHLRMNLDLYHARLGSGDQDTDLDRLVRDARPLLGEVQVADVPGRREPGTGVIDYRELALTLADTGYSGVVGLEAWASGDSASALRAFRETFTI